MKTIALLIMLAVITHSSYGEAGGQKCDCILTSKYDASSYITIEFHMQLCSVTIEAYPL